MRNDIANDLIKLLRAIVQIIISLTDPNNASATGYLIVYNDDFISYLFIYILSLLIHNCMYMGFNLKQRHLYLQAFRIRARRNTIRMSKCISTMYFHNVFPQRL